MSQKAITGVTLIDGTGAPPLENATIVIDGETIVSVGQGAAPPDAEVIDGSGRWIVPGLIDAHVHTELVGRECLPLWLALGVTTVRDLGSQLDFLVETRRLQDDGTTGQTRVLFTGPMIDGEPPTWPGLVRVTSDAEAAVAVVDEYLAVGADAIKLYTTLQPDSVRRCIEHVGGRVPVTGHLGATSASEAMRAGINGLEHALLTPYSDLGPEDFAVNPGETMMTPGFWTKVAEGWTKVDIRSDRVSGWIDLLVEKDVSFCPTLTVMVGANDEPEESDLALAPGVAARWKEGQQLRQAWAPPPSVAENARTARRKLQDLVGRVHKAGGRIVSGTDTGAIRNLVPGFSLHQELEFLSGAGLSNMDVVRCATSRAAEALWRDDLGSIAPGKRADLLLLRTNPLEHIHALRDIERVVQDGHVYDPQDLLESAASVGS